MCYKVKWFFYVPHFKGFSIHLLLSALSLIMMVVIRYISKVLVWILTVLVIIGSIGTRPDSAGTLKQPWRRADLNQSLALQGEQLSSGGSTWTTRRPTTAAPCRRLESKWRRTTWRPCWCTPSWLRSSRYDSLARLVQFQEHFLFSSSAVCASLCANEFRFDSRLLSLVCVFCIKSGCVDSPAH